MVPILFVKPNSNKMYLSMYIVGVAIYQPWGYVFLLDDFSSEENKTKKRFIWGTDFDIFRRTTFYSS